MHRKPMVSLLIGSLVFGLVLVSISWLPEVSGWQQGTLPGKRPAKRVKRSPQSSAPAVSKSSASEPAEKATTLPQAPSPQVEEGRVRIKTVSTPGARPAIAVFDIVPSEPISNEPIGGQPKKPKPAEIKAAKTNPVEAKPVEAKPEASADASKSEVAKSPVVEPQPVAEEPTDTETPVDSQPTAPIGTAVQPVEKQPVVRPAGASKTEKPTVANPRRSRFGIDIDLSIPSTEKIQDKFKSLVTSNGQKTTTGQGGQSVLTKRRPKQPATTNQVGQVKSATVNPEEPRVARRNFSFALPPIAVPRIFPATENQGESQETTEAGDGDAVEQDNESTAKAVSSGSPRPLQFQGLTPGRSSATDLKDKFGAAQAESQENGVETLTFQLGPFQQVKVGVSDKIVRSIQVFFKETYAPQDMANQLGIDQFKAVVVRDARGVETGRIYPERGATLLYVHKSDPVQVKQLILEPISPVPFLQRAQENEFSHFKAALDDLSEVQRLDPNNEEAHAMEARILLQTGQFKRASQAIQNAMDSGSDSPAHQLLQAQIQFQSGHWKKAEKTIVAVLENEQLESLHRSQATCLRGDLYGRHGQRDYQKAIQYHLDGIKQAKSLVTHSDDEVRRQARRILLDAHLSIANDIAWGDWKNKATVVPKWLSISEQLQDSLASHDSVDSAIALYVQQRTLSAYMGIGGELDAEEIVEGLTESYNQLMENHSDALFKQKVRWMTGSALYYAGRIAQQQGKSQDALRNATDAHHLLSIVTESRDVVPRSEILVGDACFLIGSLHAVYKHDHAEAVKWYAESLQGYEQPTVAEQIMNRGLHGERLVSMGLSFWQSGDQQRGLQLTRKGTELIEKAVEKENYESQILTVPYGNLVAMYRHLENDEMAEQYVERVNQLKQQDQDQATVDEESNSAAEETADEKTDSDSEKPVAEKEEANSEKTAPVTEEKEAASDEAKPVEKAAAQESVESTEAEKQEAAKKQEPVKAADEPKATATEETPAKAEKPKADKEPTVKKESADPATPQVPENPIRKAK